MHAFKTFQRIFHGVFIKHKILFLDKGAEGIQSIGCFAEGKECPVFFSLKNQKIKKLCALADCNRQNSAGSGVQRPQMPYFFLFEYAAQSDHHIACGRSLRFENIYKSVHTISLTALSNLSTTSSKKPEIIQPAACT